MCTVFYRIFLTSPLRPTLLRRCTKYLSSDIFPASSFSLVDYFKIFHISNLMGNRISIAYLKTLLGSCITARRIQATPRYCIFCRNCGADSLQHYSTCDALWHAVAVVLKPFKASFHPLELFGMSPPCPYQIYGVYLAFHAYHALRHHEFVTFDLLTSTLKAYMRGCKVHQHLQKAYLGKTRMKFLPPDPPSTTAQRSSSFQRHNSSHASLESCTNSADHDRALYRTMMPPNRQAVLRARGLPVGAPSLLNQRAA